MIAVSSDPPPDADARVRELLYFLDNVPADPDHARRDLRVGAILIAIAAAMVVQSFTGLWAGPDELFDLDVTPLGFGLAAIVPAVTGVGFLITSHFVRYERNE